MTTELRLRNQSQQLYVRAISQAWRNHVQLHDPSHWLLKEPEIEEKMLRDADIRHAVGFRRHLIAGRQWTLTPRDEGDVRAPLASYVGTELLGRIRNFTQARMNLSRAFFSGARFAKIHGRPMTLTLGDGQPRTWWVPFRLEDLDKRMFRIVPTHNEDHVTAHWERWDVAKQEFLPQSEADALTTIRHVYQDDQASLGYGSALREAIGFTWYAKTQVFRESLKAAERFGQGIVAAKIDGARNADTGLPNTELLRQWTETMEDMRSRHVIAFDKTDEIEIISGSAEGWQLFQTLRDELRSTIFTLILGANLTTAASEGGSYALAEIQENSTEALIQFDRETLEETLTDDLLSCIWLKNRPNLVDLGIADAMPRFSITQEKRQDPQERANVASTLNSMGVELSLGNVLEQTGFKKPEEGEDIIEGRSTEPAMPMPGMFRKGG